MNTGKKSSKGKQAQLSQIRTLIDNMEYDEAKSHLEENFKQNPNSVDIIDMLSEVYFNIDNCEGAIKMIKKSIYLDPEHNSDKYMTLAQLVNDPKMSVQCYNKSIEINKRDLSEKTKDPEFINDQIASAYSSIAELYMSTNLCDEPSAEEICENSLNEGFKYSPNSIDVLMQLANLRIIRKRDKEAKDALDKIYAQIKEMDTNNVDFPDNEVLLNLSKNYAEIGEYLMAIKIVDILINLDDEDLEYWYLLAFYHYMCENFKYSMKCLKNLQKVHVKLGKNGKTESMIDIEEAAKELYSKLSEIKGELTNKTIEDDKTSNETDEDVEMN